MFIRLLSIRFFSIRLRNIRFFCIKFCYIGFLSIRFVVIGFDYFRFLFIRISSSNKISRINNSNNKNSNSRIIKISNSLKISPKWTVNRPSKSCRRWNKTNRIRKTRPNANRCNPSSRPIKTGSIDNHKMTRSVLPVKREVKRLSRLFGARLRAVALIEHLRQRLPPRRDNHKMTIR